MQMLPRFAMLQKVPIEITVPGNAGIEKGVDMLSMDWDKNWCSLYFVLKTFLFLHTWQADIDYRIVLQSLKFQVHAIFSAKFVQHEVFNILNLNQS